jgi:hypothetical protein
MFASIQSQISLLKNAQMKWSGIVSLLTFWPTFMQHLFFLKKSCQQKLSCELCLLGLDKHSVWRTGWKGWTSFGSNDICLLLQLFFILWLEPSLSNCNHAASVSKPFLCSVFLICHDSGLSSVKKKNLEIVRKKIDRKI